MNVLFLFYSHGIFKKTTLNNLRYNYYKAQEQNNYFKEYVNAIP